MQRSGNYCSLVIKFMFKQISLFLIEMLPFKCIPGSTNGIFINI